jgi:hypothetical protein
MGLHDPFGFLEYELWPNQGRGIKLPIWLMTTKSQESPWFLCMQVAWHMSLQNFWQRLQIYFRPHINWRSSKTVMGLQSHKSPNFENFGTFNLGISGQNDIWVLAPWLGIKNTKRGKVVVSPKPKLWWFLWIRVCPWIIRAPKVF